MKSAFLIFAYLLMATAGGRLFAGTPNQENPVIAHLQEAFASAKKATAMDLQIGKIWDCHQFMALQDDYSVALTKNALSFNQITNNVFLNVGDYYPKTFSTSNDELVSLWQRFKGDNYFYVFTVRVLKNGDLISENANIPIWIDPKHPKQGKSIATRDYYVAAYHVCTLQK